MATAMAMAMVMAMAMASGLFNPCLPKQSLDQYQHSSHPHCSLAFQHQHSACPARFPEQLISR